MFRRSALLIVRHLNTTTSSADIPPVMSKRAAFKQIPLDMNILQKLDRLDLGFNSKRRRRIAVAINSKYTNTNQKYGARNVSSAVNNSKGKKEQHEKKKSFKFNVNNEVPYPFNYGARRASLIHTANESKHLLIKFQSNPPEVAVIGRSNVGKSTLINTLLGYNSHIESSKVSSKPGETKSLTFYSIGLRRDFILNVSNPSLMLVDMPGYGFAYLNEDDIIRCNALMMQYLLYRGSTLKRVLLLVDARHGIKMADISFFQELSNHKGNSSSISWKLQIVMTKCDLVERSELVRRIHVINTSMSEVLPGYSSSLPIILVSGKEKKGILELQKELASIVPPKEEDPKKETKLELKLARDMRVKEADLGHAATKKNETTEIVKKNRDKNARMNFKERK